MVVSLRELDLELDPREVRRGRVEDERVGARLEAVRELRDPTVGVRLAGRHGAGTVEELDSHAARGFPAGGVEHVCRERRGHGSRS